MFSARPRPPASTPAAPNHRFERPFRGGLLALFLGLSALTLGVGGWLTSLGMGAWYQQLEKPWFQPPGWVFSPVWTLLFVLLAVATWQVARRSPASGTALRLYALQLVLNVGWSLLFFALRRPAWALAEILLLDLVVVAMVVAYGRIRRVSGWLLVPYALWLGLATAINAWIVLHN